MFTIFVTVDKHQGFKSLTVKRHLSGLNVCPATLKICLLFLLTACYDRLQASIALCSS